MKLDVDVIKKHLDTRAERQIRLVDTATSTNAARRELVRAGAPEGTVVIADAQTTLVEFAVQDGLVEYVDPRR